MNLRNKKILVTGSEGFIGSHLSERLLELGAHVRAFVFYNSFNSYGWLDTLSKEKLKNIDIFTGDVRDPNGVRRALENIDIVFHLAALIGIPFSYHSPDSYVDTNIKGTLNVLQAAMAHGVRKVIITSTSEVYGSARYVPIDESHPLQAQSPYAASKIGADKIAESFYKSFGLPVVIARPFNTYGPRQSARAIIPAIITQLLSGEKEVRLGAVTPTRDFVYVKDTVEGLIAIARAEKIFGETINIATQSETSIHDVAKKIIDMIDPKAVLAIDKKRIRPEKSEIRRLSGSNKKIKRLSQWNPGYSLEKGLDETIEWFRRSENLKKYKPHVYNI